MFPRSFPAAIAVITVVSLSLPMASASSARPRVHPRNPATPAARVQVRFWHLVLGFFDPTAGAVDAAYSKLGSSLGRTRGRVEITDIFLALGAGFLVAAGALSALWAPRLP